MPARILVIDDEESMCRFMQIMLTREGYRVDSVDSGSKGISLLRQQDYDLVIADLQMPEMTGIDVLKEIKSFKRDQDLIVMTAYASVDTAIEAMKQGAADYITKPFKVDEIKLVIDKSISRKHLQEENDKLKRQLCPDDPLDSFIGNSEAAIKLKTLASQISQTESTVLILGESGTGKDLIAQAIHHQSPRRSGPFVTINCAALPENLLESELFGHKRGSFTGAIKDKDGLFKAANGGTFFLDEVGNTSMAIQVKLLRVLEDRRITPVGETKPIDVDVRLIAATNADLEDDVKAGRFRSDLYYRLHVIPIHIPPLRERADDIDLLVKHFVERFCIKNNVPVMEISDEAMELLTSYHWPGNVRELENTVERAVFLCSDAQLTVKDFPEKCVRALQSDSIEQPQKVDPTLESIEKAYIHYIMTQTGGKKTEAARILGINASTLYRKLDRYDLKQFSRHNKSDEKDERNR
ncbi:MAG: sigma-54-dependent transcriptional regulator [Candidatus Zixiibacteriota bacterium]